jgi:hypothetical protein
VRRKRPGRELVRVALRRAYGVMRETGDVKLTVSIIWKRDDHRHSTARDLGCAAGACPAR